MKILIIEDQPEVRDTLRDILEINGHEVIAADDGVQGVQAAAQRPDFIFCDVTMPRLDGPGVLAALKEMPEVREVPFVFLTANAAREDQRAGMALGADDYITKPFTERDILDAIAARTTRHQGVREKVEQLVEQQRRQAHAQWSHELLTPLNAVMGTLELLDLEADTISPTELKELLGLIRAGAERQERLARKLIRYFSLEQRLQAATPVAQSSGNAETAIAAGAAQAARELKRERDVAVAVTPGEVTISAAILQDAVYEVVSNAAIFSAPGTRVAVTGMNDGRRYRIEIVDQGPGMTTGQRGAIGAFTQFNRARREQQGLGLGLAIARATARLAGGSLGLEPGADQCGLKVIFDLPLATANK